MKRVIVLLLLSSLGFSGCSLKNKLWPKKKKSRKVAQSKKETSDFIVDDSDQDLFSEEESLPEIDKKSCDTATYEVKQGEVLMQIAFKLYGDYRRWKDLAAMNSGIEISKLKVGQKLSYCSGYELSWKPQGEPHVIRYGETLGSISKDKYGTIKRWKELWKNNRPMIHNPNLIFAGFTLYWIPDDTLANL